MTTELLPNFLNLDCPHCYRRMKRADLMTTATIVIRRTCPKCRTRWHAIIRPKTVDRNRIIAVHQVEWTAIEGRGA